jgi:hypothetical protein
MSKPDLVATTLAALLVAFCAIVIMMAILDCNEQTRCERDGGHVLQYNCRLVYVGDPATEMPTTECDWKCIGIPAEGR